MHLETLFCDPLDGERIAALRDRLRVHRVELLGGLLPGGEGAAGAELPPERRAVRDGYLAALCALLRDAPADAAALVDHWSPGVHIARLSDPHIGRAAVDQIASNLLAAMLFERLHDGSSPLQGMQLETPTDAAGAVPVFAMNASVRVRGMAPPRGRLLWRCAGRRAIVRHAGAGGAELTVPLPLPRGGGGAIEVVPFARAPRWQIPVLQDAEAALLLGGQPPGGPPLAPSGAGDRRPLPLAASLERTHEIFQAIWPDVIPWVSTLIPAFVEIPEATGRNVHLSGSVGPGAPIYLSRVEDPFLHAEDVVHEMQHHRFLLLVPSDRCFGCCGEDRQAFISPYRADPRPLFGIHLGLHAFLAVNELRRRALRAAQPTAARVQDMIRVHRMNLFAFRTIVAHERLSPEGWRFYGTIAQALLEHHEAIEPLAAAGEGRRVEAWLERHRALLLHGGARLENAMTSFGPASADDALETASARGPSPDEVRP